MNTLILPANRLTDSITSRNTSFFRYFTPSVRHETAFVTAGGGFGAISSLWPKMKIKICLNIEIHYDKLFEIDICCFTNLGTNLLV